MRIIAGKHRGRVLKEFKGRDIRPTADRAKEAIFNILQTDIVGSVFLDLFTGTGNMGIEALSRGAEKAVMVDSSKESVAIAQFNANLIKENSEIVCADALTFVLSTRQKFDIIFLDPPYKTGILQNALKNIYAKATIKVPEKKYTAYKNILKGKGQGKKVTIKKYK